MQGSPPIHYYVLANPAGQPDRQTEHAGFSGPRIGLLPITLPAYLQRQQMVIRDENNVGIRVDDFERWGEDLSAGIARVLSIAMTGTLAEVHGVVMPLRTGSPVDLRIQVDVRRFEGRPGGHVDLEAAWTIQRDGKSLREGHFQTRSGAGSTLSELVEVQSTLLLDLADALSAAVKAVL
jgi:uncharacterized lipoprotein YmbA